MALPQTLLSKSMERSFRRLKDKNRRKAYVEAELVHGVAHQIRVLRQQRNWTQAQLARRVKTTQAAISRLEDPSYGKFSINTLLQVGHVFDVALHVKYVTFSDFMCQTWDTSPQRFQVEPYLIECKHIDFYSEFTGTTFIGKIESPSTSLAAQKLVVLLEPSSNLPSRVTTTITDDSSTFRSYVGKLLSTTGLAKASNK